ncbi:uncharacterized protein A4U43_C08F31620 [Asparagus officinalis]|nr:uncharacterized protein A4U43_C08F31620 [Asparagus officinalis]
MWCRLPPPRHHPIGEASMFVTASAVHRSDAIEACQFVIERGEGIGADLEEGGLREWVVLEGEQGVLLEGSRFELQIHNSISHDSSKTSMMYHPKK